MAKLLFLALFAVILTLSFTTGQNDHDQPVKNSKPFFPSSSSKYTSTSITTSTNGPVQFPGDGDDFDQQQQKIVPSNRPIFPPQSDLIFSTVKPQPGQQSGDLNFAPVKSEVIPENKGNRQHMDPRVCTKIHDPVCGSNGRTYPNLCTLTQEQRFDSSITVVKQGEC